MTGLSMQSSPPESNRGFASITGTCRRRSTISEAGRTGSCVGWFADYTAELASRYGDRVKRFATFNEPSIFTLLVSGSAANVQRPASTRCTGPSHFINLAHGTAVDILRARVAQSSIGAIHNYQPCLPSAAADGQAAEHCDTYWNRAFPDPQCLGVYPESMRAKVEPHMQAGDQRNRSPRRLVRPQPLQPGVCQSRCKCRPRIRFRRRATRNSHHPEGLADHADAFRDTLLRRHRAL